MAEVTTNLYEFNKVNMLQIEPISKEGLQKQVTLAATEMADWNYAMLLSVERRDYTVFYTKNAKIEDIVEELIPTLENRGTIIDIYKEETANGWEIWIKDKNQENEDEAYIYYLFNYSFGVVNCAKEGEI